MDNQVKAVVNGDLDKEFIFQIKLRGLLRMTKMILRNQEVIVEGNGGIEQQKIGTGMPQDFENQEKVQNEPDFKLENLDDWQLENHKFLKKSEDKLRQLDLKLNYQTESTLRWSKNS